MDFIPSGVDTLHKVEGPGRAPLEREKMKDGKEKKIKRKKKEEKREKKERKGEKKRKDRKSFCNF